MTKKDDRAARLARQLRENLRRRKGRAREERAGDRPAAADDRIDSPAD
ncbi:hypothetical protein ACFO8O_11055 [Hephaestia sp. GCM10023244]|nr:hypothetical protein [Hephaestia sp. MAHUQ-44]MCM8731499.1 hypothetical protein [Hephaestia sp. MAHUQ-44]